MTHNFSVVILVGVCFHIPYDLVSKELRELCSLYNVPFCIAESIVSERLHYLRNIEEGDIDRVALESPYSILKQERVVPILRKKQSHSRDGVDRCPIQEILHLLASEQSSMKG